MTEIKKATELGDSIKKEMSKIFTDGFYHWLSYFSKDKKRLVRAFTHMFNPDVFYIALVNGKAVGMAACTNSNQRSVRLDKKELKKHLGFLKGSFAYTMLKRQFENHPYPFELKPDMGSVEFVAVSSQYRGKGVASSIITHIHKSAPYMEYVLEVADSNTSAIKLYERLGYKEIVRMKQKNAKRSGIHYLIYMEYTKK